MSPRGRGRERSSPVGVELRDRETVKPLELFFDLVFVLGFTQCTALMATDPTWAGLGRGVLVLAVIWWAWVLYTWLTSVIEPEEGPMRLVLISAMTGLLVVALSVPEAFGERALLFAIAYAFVRLGHIAPYFLVARHTSPLPPVRRFALVTVIVIALLAGASFLEGGAQVALWGLAIAVDVGAPAVSGDAGWRLAPGHFAERHNLVIILALGESVVALGTGADVDLTPLVLLAAALGIWLASAYWWLYFDVVAPVTHRRLERTPEGPARMALARDAYSYLHFPMVAGIVLSALGIEEALHHVDEPLDSVHADKCTVRLKAGDVVRMLTPGGGGWDRPLTS